MTPPSAPPQRTLVHLFRRLPNGHWSEAANPEEPLPAGDGRIRKDNLGQKRARERNESRFSEEGRRSSGGERKRRRGREKDGGDVDAGTPRAEGTSTNHDPQRRCGTFAAWIPPPYLTVVRPKILRYLQIPPENVYFAHYMVTYLTFMAVGGVIYTSKVPTIIIFWGALTIKLSFKQLR